MPFSTRPSTHARHAMRDVARTPFWLDRADSPEPRAPLTADTQADLVIVGAGLTGLWAALTALAEQPDRDVLLLDSGQAGWAASGRNGGFLAASLTHGIPNGMSRWPDEMPTLMQLGQRNLDETEKALAEFGIDCDWQRAGEITVATENYQLAELRQIHDQAVALGEARDWLDRDQVRALVNSPTYLAATWQRDSVAMIDPARLVWGLRETALRRGARLHEQTTVIDIESEGAGLALTTDTGAVVNARQVLLATNVFKGLIPQVRRRVVPVYDYVIMTEPLTPEQHARIGWTTRAGVGDSGNQFHYYRMTEDRRILFGGYDAIYPFAGRMRREYLDNPTSWARLADHFWQTFPQLRDVRFTHAWGGVIDASTRFSAFWGTEFDGRLAYVAGYTGLGVGASRFGAMTALDLLAGRSTERTRLEMVRSKPLPFPAEPVRWLGIQMTRKSMGAADLREGRRNLWLRSMDALGLGFDS